MGFLETLKPYCVSEVHSLGDQRSIWRKRYLTFLNNVLIHENHDDLNKRQATFLIQQKRPLEEEKNFWDSVKIEKELILKEVNSHLQKQDNMERGEAGTSSEQKRSYGKELPSTPPNKVRTFNRISPNEGLSMIRDSRIMEVFDENVTSDLKEKAQRSATHFLPKKRARNTQQEAEKDVTDEDLANSVIDASSTFGQRLVLDDEDMHISEKTRRYIELFDHIMEEENVEDIYDDVVVDEVARSDLVDENNEETKNMEGDDEKFNKSIAKMEEIVSEGPNNPDPDKINEDRQKLMNEGVFAINKFMTRTGLPTWEVCSTLKVFLAQGFGDNVEIGQMIFIGSGLYLFSPFTIPALVIPTSADNLEHVLRLIRTLLCLRYNVLKEVKMFEMFAKEGKRHITKPKTKYPTGVTPERPKAVTFAEFLPTISKGERKRGRGHGRGGGQDSTV
ncbi:14378_t:CDS:2 [Acaulospora colombiana]|uniref:14378_t:CDS:1 n=1 Tax=Acaulospora colombiana TaxID=27376 RepID=A0ACA9MER4_9GLOM|nr:14378_t:CDS:2 [Acaulospora colombiana]